MERLITATPKDILISDEEKDLPLILTYINHFPRTPIFDRFDDLQISGVDEFNFTDEFIKTCKGVDPVDVLLDWIKSDGKFRYRNYTNVKGVSFLYRHPRCSLRSIVNHLELYDKPKLYWYYLKS